MSAMIATTPTQTKPKTELRAQSGARVRFAETITRGGGGGGAPASSDSLFDTRGQGRAPPRSTAE